jgi:agmatine deiminase
MRHYSLVNSISHIVKGFSHVITLFAVMTIPTYAADIQSYMPDEASRHEGTWLQWPHHYTYGTAYRNSLDATWIAMTKALVTGEKVHIIAYNTTEKTRIAKLLQAAAVPLTNVNFILRQTNDVWVRDNGPIFVYANNGQLKITDWGFNGWGYDAPYVLDNTVPTAVAASLNLPRIDLNTTVLEGGAVEVDGKGVMIATRSSTLQNGRNLGLSQTQFENMLTTYWGITKFIWLDGAFGGKDDITDTHIDGFVHFGPKGTLVTMNDNDLNYWGLSATDINRLHMATDVTGTPYTLVKLPLTAKNVSTTSGSNLGFKGSYVNYYVGNTVVLVPIYNDANDAIAIKALQQLYLNRKIVGIDVRNLYKNGGMVHCVTQQQPA